MVAARPERSGWRWERQRQKPQPSPMDRTTNTAIPTPSPIFAGYVSPLLCGLLDVVGAGMTPVQVTFALLTKLSSTPLQLKASDEPRIHAHVSTLTTFGKFKLEIVRYAISGKVESLGGG